MCFIKTPQSFRVGASCVREPWVNESATDDPSEGDGQALCVGIVEILHIVQGWAWTFLFAQTLVVDPHDCLGIREKGQFGRSSEERQWPVDLGHGERTHGTQMSRAAVAVCYAFRQPSKNDGLIPEIGYVPPKLALTVSMFRLHSASERLLFMRSTTCCSFITISSPLIQISVQRNHSKIPFF